jgi:hypothetical protein
MSDPNLPAVVERYEELVAVANSWPPNSCPLAPLEPLPTETADAYLARAGKHYDARAHMLRACGGIPKGEPGNE